MWKRSMPALVLILLVVASFARAQTTAPADTPPTVEQAVTQQMRDTFQTIVQNMIAKGIDPRAFFQQIRDGADPADIQKQLVSQGLIDQKTLDELQSNMLALTAIRIQRQLDMNDDDWKAIWPLVQKVITAQSALSGTRPGTGMARFFTAQTPAGADLTTATKKLTAAAADSHADTNELTNRLREFRDAKAKAQQDLDAARGDLQSVLTIRQEGILTSLGILE
jgi:hypothetical protein